MARVTVEDCLEKVPSRFALVSVASKRTRQLLKGAEKTVKSKNRESVTSLREIAKGTIVVEQDVKEMEEQMVETLPASVTEF
ncbi:MAG: DNA-directed RNA polymerase subunit omega [Deltaproteobacteria bacterium]|nr:DNA-directed RNA polymerase subunit omega [Deltaproteobacteria bacterium]MBN2673105.1 DNA-directed RNA polymerase subunit omega [Deltaproteobacteria bacterium]